MPIVGKKQKLKVEVEVWGIEVERTSDPHPQYESGWWKFEYSIRINGGKKKLGEKDGSWSSQTRKHFISVLKRGYAAKEVLGDYAY